MEKDLLFGEVTVARMKTSLYTECKVFSHAYACACGDDAVVQDTFQQPVALTRLDTPPGTLADSEAERENLTGLGILGCQKLFTVCGLFRNELGAKPCEANLARYLGSSQLVSQNKDSSSDKHTE